jgi:trimethylamine--corrinoid protein Co-methyltransferase
MTMMQSYNLLTDAEIQMVHEASLEVLRTTGLRLNHPVALEKLSGAGAKVDAAKEKVRLPAEMVEKALVQRYCLPDRTPAISR